MSYTVRIDKITKDQAGAISIEYTQGEPPLPAEAGGLGMSFDSGEQLQAFIHGNLQNIDPSVAISLLLARLDDLTNPSLASMAGKRFEVQGTGVFPTVVMT